MDRAAFKGAKQREKTVTRAYGGSRCGNCVRQRYFLLGFYSNLKLLLYLFFILICNARIVRAFLVEEQKIVKRVLLEKQKN
jgi:large subunit ribosomal protein L34e